MAELTISAALLGFDCVVFTMEGLIFELPLTVVVGRGLLAPIMILFTQGSTYSTDA